MPMVKYELSEKLVRHTRSDNHKAGNSANRLKKAMISAVSCIHLTTILTASHISKNTVIQIPNINIIFKNVPV